MTTPSVNDLPFKQVKTAILNTSTLGSNALVAATGAGTYIKVTSVVLIAGASANTIHFLSAANAITAQFALAGNGGMVLNANQAGWFVTAENEALNINLSSATAVGVTITYTIEST